MKLRKILKVKQFKNWLENEIGKRCKDYCWDCFICRSWRVYDEVEGYVEHIEILDKPFPKKKKLFKK